MTNVEVTFEDNKDEALRAFSKQVEIALKAIGNTAEGHAKDDCPVDTGRLRNSITYSTSEYAGTPEYQDDNGEHYYDGGAKGVPKENELYIGTNVEYAASVEYRDINHKTGKAHFLRDAATTHGDEYKAILKAALED